mmetsp:Transcript_4703/g.7107  ORF Transcript_4703/g.7107 Transcript_4703/m.7107 type:complete len:146 (-) Transcript_4703:297-734(-)
MSDEAHGLLFQRTMNSMLKMGSLQLQGQASIFKCTHCSHDNCAISTLKGARNGFFYGSRLRFAHAFVMSILFGRGNLNDRVKWAVKMAVSHGLFLTLLVSSFKSAQCILVRAFQKNTPWVALLAGAVSSRVVQGRYNREFLAVLK